MFYKHLIPRVLNQKGEDMSSEVSANDSITKSVDSVGKSWLLVLLLGLLTIGAGVASLNHPGQAYHTVAVLLGVWLVVSGAVSIGRGLVSGIDGGMRVLLILSGLVSLFLGGMFFRESSIGEVALLSLYIGITFLFRGVIELVAGVTGNSDSGRGWAIFMGIIGIIAGFYMINHPFGGALIWMTTVGWFLIFFGVVEVFGSFKLRSASKA